MLQAAAWERRRPATQSMHLFAQARKFVFRYLNSNAAFSCCFCVHVLPFLSADTWMQPWKTQATQHKQIEKSIKTRQKINRNNPSKKRTLFGWAPDRFLTDVGCQHGPEEAWLPFTKSTPFGSWGALRANVPRRTSQEASKRPQEAQKAPKQPPRKKLKQQWFDLR